ncbi:hypothetical protein JHK85_017032 [Glycine max]|nr:hypothetical protein JHK85_017032 [Glycine max]
MRGKQISETLGFGGRREKEHKKGNEEAEVNIDTLGKISNISKLSRDLEASDLNGLGCANHTPSTSLVYQAGSPSTSKVGIALDIVEKMCEAGFTLSTEVLQCILQICEESYEYILVHRIYSIICRYHLELNGEICRRLVHFFVRMKDFEGAYRMIADLEDMNFKPTTNMYNAIMAGYFREKNIRGGLRVLNQMRGANVKPDSHTFYYLIQNCETEEDIIKNLHIPPALAFVTS